MEDTRSAIVAWAQWAVANKKHFNYSEGSNRSEAIGVYPPRFPMFMDCSMFVTWCYYMSGALHDPTNEAGFATHTGYTGTELGVGQEIPESQVLPGDTVVYGNGTGVHTALIVGTGSDPKTISMGEQGDPSYVTVATGNPVPGQQVRFLRFNTQGTPRFPNAPVVHPVKKAAKTVASPFVYLFNLIVGLNA